MSRKTQKFFITISKFNRGSLTPEELSQIKAYFDFSSNNHDAINQLFDEVFAVNEHKNKKKEFFEHVHIYVKTSLECRSDKLREKVKNAFSFIQHPKDLDIRAVTCLEQLLAGYMMKTEDFDIILNKGIKDEYLNECKDYVQLKNDFREEKLKKFSVERISDLDLPYIMKEYIQDKQIDYDMSLDVFIHVINKMVLDGYDMKIEKMPHVKAKLDLITHPEDGFVMMNALIRSQFLFIDNVYNCKNGKSDTEI